MASFQRLHCSIKPGQFEMLRSARAPFRWVGGKLRWLRQYSSTTNLPVAADAVVIGGGSLGCSTLYHLTKLGLKNVVLLERNKLTAGTTWHTAGLVWSLRPNDTDIQLLRTTREMLARLEEETGVNPGWNMNGGLFLASTKERLDEYKRLHTIGKAFGIYSEVLSPIETKRLFPLLDERTLYGTMYSPTDGNVDPSGLCTALTRYATRQGAKVIENCQVTSIQTEDSTRGTKNVKGVETSQGLITTPVIINCTGAWSPRICEMLGISIPLIPMQHSYVVFDRIEEVKGMPNLRDHDEAIYFRIQSDTLSIGGYEMNPVIIDKVQEDLAFGLYELDWEIFGTHITGATKRIPKLASVGIKSTICGPESFTPDHKPLLGEDPVVNGFFHGCGFNSAGMMFGGGCGDQLAKWVVNGQPDLDMFAYDIRRFSPQLCKNKEWAKERSHEAYAKNYSIVYKNDEPLAGRNQFLSPFHPRLAAAGCVYQERQGWERPGYFTQSGTVDPVNVQVLPYDWYAQYDFESHPNNVYAQRLEMEYTFEFPRTHDLIRAECEACRTACAVFDMSYFGKMFLIGPDAQAAAQYLFSNQMNRAVGSVIYTCFLNPRGGVETDLTVTVMDPSQILPEDPDFSGLGYYLAIGGNNQTYTKFGILSALKSKEFDVELVDLSQEFGLLSIQGPKSRSVLQKLFPGSQFKEDDFPFSTCQILHFNHIPIRALRVSFVGEMGWELHVPKAHCIPLYDAMMSLGQEFGLRNGGYRAIDSLSIEKGYRHWHADLRPDDTPLEAGLAFTCKLKDREDFIGRAALVEQQRRGIRKRLTCFTLEGKQTPLWGLEAIWDERYPKSPVGYLRVADYGFTIGKSMGYGYVNAMEEDAGPEWVKSIGNGKYSIEVMGQRIPATARLSSTFDPKNLRVHGVYD